VMRDNQSQDARERQNGYELTEGTVAWQTEMWRSMDSHFHKFPQHARVYGAETAVDRDATNLSAEDL